MTRRKIFTTDPADIAAAVLAELGFSNVCIRRKVGQNQQGKVLSDSMISYRLKYLDSRKPQQGTGRRRSIRQLTRDGLSPGAVLVIRHAYEPVERLVVKQASRAASSTGRPARKGG